MIATNPADTDHDAHGNPIKLYYSERQRLFELRVAEEPTREEAIDLLERLGRERARREQTALAHLITDKLLTDKRERFCWLRLKRHRWEPLTLIRQLPVGQTYRCSRCGHRTFKVKA